MASKLEHSQWLQLMRPRLEILWSLLSEEAVIYLVEVKDKLNDPDVIDKKKRGIQYCEVATRWGKANGYKECQYLFIPSKQVMPNSSFIQLAQRFQEL